MSARYVKLWITFSEEGWTAFDNLSKRMYPDEYKKEPMAAQGLSLQDAIAWIEATFEEMEKGRTEIIFSVPDDKEPKDGMFEKQVSPSFEVPEPKKEKKKGRKIKHLTIYN